MEIEDKELLKGILLALLEGKSRKSKVKILKETGFKQSEIIGLCGPSATTLRTRKHRARKKDEI